MRSIKYLCLLLPILLLAACGDDEEEGSETPPCQDKLTQDWQVDEYTVGAQDQSTQNVRVSFTASDYTLVLPQVNEFGTSGNWETNENCTEITLTDADGNELKMSTDLSVNNQLTLMFEYSNFKEQPVAYRIVLVSNS